MIVGYARTSTAGQVAGLEAQERELRAAGCDKICASGCHRWPSANSLRRHSTTARGDSFSVPSSTGWPGRWATCWRSWHGWKPNGSPCGSCRCPAIKPRYRHEFRQAHTERHRCRWASRARGHQESQARGPIQGPCAEGNLHNGRRRRCPSLKPLHRQSSDRPNLSRWPTGEYSLNFGRRLRRKAIWVVVRPLTPNFPKIGHSRFGRPPDGVAREHRNHCDHATLRRLQAEVFIRRGISGP